METNRFFQMINKLNSILLLVIIIGVGITVLISFMTMNDWQKQSIIEVIDESKTGENKKINLRLGDIEEVNGHDVQYVTLTTEKEGGKFSSGYGSSQIRNVLFFIGEDMQSSWLYTSHSNLILCVCKLRKNNDTDNVIGIYLNVVKTDTNGDGVLSKDDDNIIALLNIDGSGYKEVETGIKKVISNKVTKDGKHIIFLVQVGTNVIMKKYSLETSTKVSEKVITGISKVL